MHFDGSTQILVAQHVAVCVADSGSRASPRWTVDQTRGNLASLFGGDPHGGCETQDIAHVLFSAFMD